MADWQDRARIEQSELVDRHGKLCVFLNDPDKTSAIDPVDVALLRAQAAAMGCYLEILTMRIARFGGS